MRVVTFKVSDELYEQLKHQAGKKRITVSELIRRAIRYYLEQDDNKPYITRRIRVY